MCGICGYASFSRPADERWIHPMTEKLRHRGPDDHGHYHDSHVVLGHRRLSIIDPASGHQPIFSEDRTIVIIQNGEFYNFSQTREELTNKGHRFYTHSDAEIFAHLYEDYGVDAIRHVQGMFAVALYDKKNQRLLLCRDRLGQKPLYYSVTPQGIVFASELKSLMAHPWISRTTNTNGLHKYLFYDYIPGEETIYRGVNKLPAGHLLTVDLKTRRVIKAPYWDISLFNREAPYSLETAREHLSRQLNDAVEKRLRADVRVGVLLSGGIDSSIIGRVTRDLRENQLIPTFSVGYQEESYDESRYSAFMAKALQSEHHHFRLTPELALTTLRKVQTFIDEPFADPSLIPTFFLAEQTRRHVKVALGGDGSDELFAGYQVFPLMKAYWPLRRYRQTLDPFTRLLSIATPVNSNYSSAAYCLNRFRESLPIENAVIQMASLFGSFSLKEIRELTGDSSKAFQENLLSEMNTYLDKRRTEDPISQMQYCLTKSYLGEGVLVKIDRASMANSLEVRSPFLDHNLFDDVFAHVPTSLKIRNFRTKYLLKKTFQGRLPDEILHRSKKGFAMPLASWIRTSFNHEIRRLLEPRRISSQGFLNPVYVSRIVDEHFNGTKDHRKKIWSLLILQYWIENDG